MSAADLDRPAVPASDAAGEAAMTDWAELLVAQARAEGAGADRRERAADGLGAPGAPGRAWRSRRPGIWAVSVTLRRAEGRGTRGTVPRPSGSPPRSARLTWRCRGTGRARSSRPRRRKHRRRLDGLSGNVISLYGQGPATGEIQGHLAEIYDTSVSRDTIPADHRRDRRRHGGAAEPHRSSRCMRCC